MHINLETVWSVTFALAFARLTDTHRQMEPSQKQHQAAIDADAAVAAARAEQEDREQAALRREFGAT